jgi:hypothetical protein
MGFEVLHRIVDCLWVIGEPISAFMEGVESETGILTEVNSYDWITFLSMSDGGGACNRYCGKLNTDKMKIRWVMARKGDTRIMSIGTKEETTRGITTGTRMIAIMGNRVGTTRGSITGTRMMAIARTKVKTPASSRILHNSR